MYVVTVELDIVPMHSQKFKTAIRRQAASSVEREDGCLTFEVCSSEGEPHRFLLYEIYRDKEAFEFHRKQEHSKEYRVTTKPWIRSQTIQFWRKLGEVGAAPGEERG